MCRMQIPVEVGHRVAFAVVGNTCKCSLYTNITIISPGLRGLQRDARPSMKRMYGT